MRRSPSAIDTLNQAEASVRFDFAATDASRRSRAMHDTFQGSNAFSNALEEGQGTAHLVRVRCSRHQNTRPEGHWGKGAAQPLHLEKVRRAMDAGSTAATQRRTLPTQYPQWVESNPK